MKKTFLITIAFLLLIAEGIKAQSPILQNVKIEFEKKVNAWATLPPQFADRMKSQIPQYTTTNYTYETDGSKALYKALPQADNNNSAGGFMRRFAPGGNDNTSIYSNFKTDEQLTLKDVLGKTYLFTDSMPHYEWKITNEFRNIAGFNCRRANAIIMDSVFVVAFYTDEITAPGGPESMGGLPGMILGLVINRVHTTWYATKVSVVDVDPKDIVKPEDKKAEITTKEALIKTLQNGILQSGGGRFGNMGDILVWGIMI